MAASWLPRVSSTSTSTAISSATPRRSWWWPSYSRPWRRGAAASVLSGAQREVCRWRIRAHRGGNSGGLGMTATSAQVATAPAAGQVSRAENAATRLSRQGPARRIGERGRLRAAPRGERRRPALRDDARPRDDDGPVVVTDHGRHLAGLLVDHGSPDPQVLHALQHDA